MVSSSTTNPFTHDLSGRRGPESHVLALLQWTVCFWWRSQTAISLSEADTLISTFQATSFWTQATITRPSVSAVYFETSRAIPSLLHENTYYLECLRKILFRREAKWLVFEPRFISDTCKLQTLLVIKSTVVRTKDIKAYESSKVQIRRSQWPRGLRRGSSAARLLVLRVRIPPSAWLFFSCWEVYVVR